MSSGSLAQQLTQQHQFVAVDRHHLRARFAEAAGAVPGSGPALQPAVTLADAAGTDAHRQTGLGTQVRQAACGLQTALAGIAARLMWASTPGST